MELCVGTSGYSYKEWKGPFYPEKLPASEMLRFYAERLSAVEINNTFYRMPKTSVLESWARQVPEHFRFSIKASRRITHFKRLKDAGEETGFLLRAVHALGARLGAVLFQLPPNLKCDAERLDAFLELLPDGTPAAFEFRHASWLDEAIFERLRARDFACAVADVEGAEAALVSTARWGYLRLRRPGYERADLAGWANRLDTRGWERAFVFFKHEDAGAGPRMAAEFLELASRMRARKGAKRPRSEPKASEGGPPRKGAKRPRSEAKPSKGGPAQAGAKRPRSEAKPSEGGPAVARPAAAKRRERG